MLAVGCFSSLSYHTNSQHKGCGKARILLSNHDSKDFLIYGYFLLQIEGGDEQVTLKHDQSVDLFLTSAAIESSKQRGMISKFAKLPTPTISIKVGCCTVFSLLFCFKLTRVNKKKSHF